MTANQNDPNWEMEHDKINQEFVENALKKMKKHQRTREFQFQRMRLFQMNQPFFAISIRILTKFVGTIKFGK